MQTIKLNKPSLGKDWSMQMMDDSHYDVLFKHSVSICKPDGSPLLVLLKKSLDEERVGLAWSALKKINMVTNNRGMASGIENKKRNRQDGTLSNTTKVAKGWDAISGIIGYFERSQRFPYARACAWNADNPMQFTKIFPLVQQASELFAKHVPERYKVQKSIVDRTHKDWVIPGTVYTTLTVNKNFRTAAHLDAGDLEEGFSNMIVMKHGLVKGGHLVLPNWRLAVELDTYDLVMFDAHEYHGNTQVVPISKGAVRCSIVCYYRTKMQFCKSAKEELEIVKNRKPGPLFPEVE